MIIIQKIPIVNKKIHKSGNIHLTFPELCFIMCLVHKMRKREVNNVVRSNIEAERGRMQKTKTAMCNDLGITLKTYNGYIKGSMIPSNILEKLRDMTGKSVDYLLGLDNDRKTA